MSLNQSRKQTGYDPEELYFHKKNAEAIEALKEKAKKEGNVISMQEYKEKHAAKEKQKKEDKKAA